MENPNYKPEEHIDMGNGEGYDFNWFADLPKRQPRPTHPPGKTEPYVPEPGVIEQNQMFEYALQSAPNVLYARFKQYGQLGVLAWCSEFSEMIDSIKELGIAGNMFVNTRAQALATCEEILNLKLEIKMQIIVMFLSSQVARLRRFLDNDKIWNDYPEIDFPLDMRTYPGAGQ